MSWKKDIDEIERRRTLAAGQGGEEAVARHHARGKLTIRERIDAVLDADSFREHGRMAGAAYFDEQGSLEEFVPANYVVGLGRIDDRLIAVGGEDFTLKGGSPNAAGLRKSVYAEHLAVTHHVPLVRLLEGGGGSVGAPAGGREPVTVGQPVYADPRFAIVAQALDEVPVVSAALGPVAGFPAGRLVASHFSVMTRDTAQVMIGGPALVERALGMSLTKEELGGATVHAASGVVDNIAADEAHALAELRRFLSYLPSSSRELAPRVPTEDPPNRRDEALASIVPADRRTSFRIRDIVDRVVDTGSYFEIGATYGPSISVGLARLAGQSIGVIANDCRTLAGAMTAEAAQKTTRMIRLCERFHLPVVNFVDEPGFMIGPDAERAGTIRHGMDAVLAAARATVPWAAVQVHKSFGVAAAAHYGTQAYVLSWPSAETGALPVEGGVAVAYGRKIAKSENPEKVRRELEEKLATERSPFPAAESFSVHELIDPRDTRTMLCDWIEWIQARLAACVNDTARSG